MNCGMKSEGHQKREVTGFKWVRNREWEVASTSPAVQVDWGSTVSKNRFGKFRHHETLLLEG